MQASEMTIEQRDTRMQDSKQHSINVFANPNDRLMSVSEVAQEVDVSGTTIYHWVSTGKLKARRVGTNILVFIWSEVKESLKGTKYAR